MSRARSARVPTHAELPRNPGPRLVSWADDPDREGQSSCHPPDLSRQLGWFSTTIST